MYLLKYTNTTKTLTVLTLPWGEWPSCLQTTDAALSSQDSSQIVPQVLLMHTSILPMVGLESPVIRTSPSEHRSNHRRFDINTSFLSGSHIDYYLHIGPQQLQRLNSVGVHSHFVGSQE